MREAVLQRIHSLRGIVFAGITTVILLVFGVAAYQGGEHHLIMPLDDVYIHFQYARQIAEGQPYVYNPGETATSGATSLIYPWLLAAGYAIGFQGLNPGLWAMLIGAVSLLLSQWSIYRLCRAFQCPLWLSLLTPVSFALTGSVAWHFMSGMETGLMITFTLLTLLMVVEKRLTEFIIAATLLAITRPEGSIMAGIAAVTMLPRLWQHTSSRLSLLWLMVPVLAIGLQPGLNYMLTGSFSAAGSQAKSILAMVPQDYGVILSRILENFIRIWTELLTGYSSQEGWYLPVFTVPTALLGIVLLLFQRGWRWIGLLLIGWMLALSGAVATLDNAFWHFKRYQMPLMALSIVMAAGAVAQILLWTQRDTAKKHIKQLQTGVRLSIYGFDALIVPVFVLMLLMQFVHYHRVNVGYVYQQPYQMALWLRENTPPDARIAVHDVGMMRYLGERNTLDMVGLTTPGAAAWWRNGPGSVAAFLLREQPDYIASYGEGHGYGLYMLEESIYGEPLATFSVDLQPHLNVALAADTQGIYRFDLSETLYISSESDDGIAQTLNVADIASEETFDYQWASVNLIGFPTEVRNQPAMNSGTTQLHTYRRINGSEEFTFSDDHNQDIIVTTTVHAACATQLQIQINGNLLPSRVIVENPGYWMSFSSFISRYLLEADNTIQITPQTSDCTYMPASHTLTSLNYEITPPQTEPVASYQEGAFDLIATQTTVSANGTLSLNTDWFTEGQAEGDYRFFVHLYDDRQQSPVKQWDGYIYGNPPANWLPGSLTHTVSMDLRDLETGSYALAIGFYNPYTYERLIPVSDTYETLSDGRLFLDVVEID